MVPSKKRHTKFNPLKVYEVVGKMFSNKVVGGQDGDYQISAVP